MDFLIFSGTQKPMQHAQYVEN